MEQDKLLDIEIVTPQKVIYQGTAVSVTVPGTKGPFQILNLHAPIVSTLETGITKVVDESENFILFATTSGFTEVHKNKISILVEDAVSPDEIDSEAVRNELAKAKDELKNAANAEEIRNTILFAENKLKIAAKV